MLTGATADLRLDPGAGSRFDSRILVICPNEVQYSGGERRMEIEIYDVPTGF